MSEAAAVAEVSAEAAPAPAEVAPTDAEIVGGLGLVSDGETTPTQEEAKPEDKPPEKPAATDKKKTRREFEAFLMSEAELAKPDGLKKAADYWQRRQSKLDAIDIQLSKKGERLHTDRDAAQKWFAEEQAKLEADRTTARNLVALVKRLQDPENMGDVLDAIGEITGRRGAGREVWEKLARFAIKGGTREAASPEVARMREELAELRQQLAKQPEEQAQRSKAEKDAQLRAQIAEREKQVIATAGDPAKYPELARQLQAMPSLGKNLIADVVALRRKARENGSPIDIPAALGRIESALAKRAQVPARSVSEPTNEREARGPVTATVTSIAPSQARSATVVRDLTQEERERDLAADTGFLGALLGI